MRRSMRHLLNIILIITFFPASGFAGGFTQGAIESEAKALMNKMQIPRDVAYTLKSKLRAALEEPILSHAVQSKGVDAVMVYRSGEGGMVVKFMKGEGLVSFNGGRKAVPIFFKSWSIGAMIGGSAQWGIGLITGLANEGDFGGNYQGAVKSATAVEFTTAGMVILTHAGSKSEHSIYLISSGRGLSAGVGNEIMTIIPDW
jgi:hypothetical protein